MILRKAKLKKADTAALPKGFDDFEVRLGDLMRGERATMGKSLLDVQTELRIKASYISAIEDCDPSGFETPGFIAGYVRSYARYLKLDPDMAFAQFCAESGFSTAHGMSEEASGVRKVQPVAAPKKKTGADALGSSTAFIPERESFFARVEPGALGSVAVLVALIAALGYGGWSILTEVQRVQFAPVEQAPDVLSDLDPIQEMPGGTLPQAPELVSTSPRANEGLDRLYRPEALEVPVLVARDAPIATLNPAEVGTFAGAPETGGIGNASAEDRAVAAALAGLTEPTPGPNTPQVTETAVPGVTLVAVRPAWVRVSAADGSVIFEKILDAGEEYQVPLTEEPPLLRAGMSGSLYASVNGEIRGPLGPGTTTIRGVALTSDAVTDAYAVADLTTDPVAEQIMLAKARQLEVPAE